MQVAMLSDAITHAVIGKQASIEMGVSDSAALMHIFSTTLYTYPRLATVREIICNGWDGHIITDRTDIPLQITLDSGLLSIRDFGPGIPHEKIGQIYGVFGNSTKRDDSTQTGGFGLGSKAPFSYVDNFEVVSHHAGVKTVYRISKSSMEAGGKPSIDTIVSLPTTETGLQVKVNIRSEHMEEFAKLINEVLILGEIKASVNGQAPVEGLPLENSPTGYLINSFSGTLTTRINVRYGNVVYPLPKHAAYEADWRRVLSSMDDLWSRANIIFMCPPDAVSIAPSREALILTEGTVATLKALLESFDSTLGKTAKISSGQIHAAAKNKALREEKLDLNSFARDLPVARFKNRTHSTGALSFTTRQAFLSHALQQKGEVSASVVLEKRIKHAGKQGLLDHHFAKDIHKRLASAKYARVAWGVPRIDLTRVFHKHVTQPAYALLETEPVLTKDRLYCVLQTGYWANPGLTKLKDAKVALENALWLLPFGVKRVILGRSKTAITDALDSSNKDQRGGWLAYHVQNNEKIIAKVEAAFIAAGYEVKNVIPVKEEVEFDPLAPVVVRKATPKRKGYLSLAASVDGNAYLLNAARASDLPEITDPVAYVVLRNKAESAWYFSSFERGVCQWICENFGDKIAVVTSPQIPKMEKLGVPSVTDYINKYVDDTLSARPDFPRYLAFARNIENVSYHEKAAPVLLGAIRRPELMEKLGLRFSISPETAFLLTYYRTTATRRGYKLDKCDSLAGKVKPYPGTAALLSKINNSPWRQFVCLPTVGETLLESTNEKDVAVASEILINLLK
jgi:hypothetical protein